MSNNPNGDETIKLKRRRLGGKGPSPYIDLGGFVQMLKREGANDATSQAAGRVLSRLKASILAEKHGEGKRGATGVSIYFPNSSLSGPPDRTAVLHRHRQKVCRRITVG